MQSIIDYNDAALIVIDLQERLSGTIKDIENVVTNVKAFIKTSKLYKIPIITVEQEKLGVTVSEVDEILDSNEKIPKTHFSCYREKRFKDKLESLDVTSVILCGIESHICVTQTALDLADNDYHVYLPIDATSSYDLTDWETVKLRMISSENISVCSTEMLLYEVAKDSSDERFKDLLKIVKERRIDIE